MPLRQPPQRGLSGAGLGGREGHRAHVIGREVLARGERELGAVGTPLRGRGLGGKELLLQLQLGGRVQMHMIGGRRR